METLSHSYLLPSRRVISSIPVEDYVESKKTTIAPTPLKQNVKKARKNEEKTKLRQEEPKRAKHESKKQKKSASKERMKLKGKRSHRRSTDSEDQSRNSSYFSSSDSESSLGSYVETNRVKKKAKRQKLRF